MVLVRAQRQHFQRRHHAPLSRDSPSPAHTRYEATASTASLRRLLLPLPEERVLRLKRRMSVWTTMQAATRLTITTTATTTTAAAAAAAMVLVRSRVSIMSGPAPRGAGNADGATARHCTTAAPPVEGQRRVQTPCGNATLRRLRRCLQADCRWAGTRLAVAVSVAVARGGARPRERASHCTPWHSGVAAAVATSPSLQCPSNSLSRPHPLLHLKHRWLRVVWVQRLDVGALLNVALCRH